MQYAQEQITGRPTVIEYEKAEPILRDFFSGNIGAKECWEKLGYSGSPRMSSKKVTSEYMEAHGIKTYRNNIDLRIAKNGEVRSGEHVGYVVYLDGRTEDLIYCCEPEVKAKHKPSREEIERFLYGNKGYEKRQKEKRRKWTD